jgi:Resolvase, N terminal domain
MVTRIDRLARSIGDLQDIVRAVKAKGATLKATEQPIDTGTAAGKCFLDMLGVFAEFETSLRKERQMQGIAKAKAAGVYKGRPASIDPAQIQQLKWHGAVTDCQATRHWPRVGLPRPGGKLRLTAFASSNTKPSRTAGAFYPNAPLSHSTVHPIARNVATPKKETQARVVRPNVTGKMYALAERPTEGNRESLFNMAASLTDQPKRSVGSACSSEFLVFPEKTGS